MATLKNTTVDTTGAIQLPVGTTAQRPTASAGHMRYNSSFKTVETYDGTRWRYMPDIVREGLVLNLDAGEPSSYPGSGTIWADLSGNSNNGTLTNGPTYSSANGGSLVFDGVDDIISIPNSSTINFTDKLTISIWCSAQSLTNFDGILGKVSNGNWTDGYGFYYVTPPSSNSTIYFFVGHWFNFRAGYQLGIGTITSFPTTNFTGTYDGSNVKIYRNGQFASQVGLTTTIISTSTSLEIMRLRDVYYTSGSVSNVSIYNRALTPQEIQQNYLALKGRFS